MLVKFMSGEGAADDDSRKQFRVFSSVKSVEFIRSDNGSFARMEFEHGVEMEYHLSGNAYVMNDAGKTVSSFGIAQLPAPQNDCSVPAP
jgi:hypothetical protein